MRIGTLDRRVAIQRKTVSHSNSGMPIETWSTVATRWASFKAVQGQELFVAQVTGKMMVEFVIRWEQAIADLSDLDRIVFPADDTGDSPIPTRSLYDIVGVLPVGRNEIFRIQAFQRSDVTP